MSKENSPQDWDKLWIEFNKSLKTWMGAFEYLQRATSDVQSKYNEAVAQTLKDSNDKTISRFIETWQKSMINTGLKTIKQFGDAGNSATNKKEIIDTPGQAINDLIKLGDNLGVHTGILETASKILTDPNQDSNKTACGKLSMFINQVNQNHKLTSSQKSQLIEYTNAIKTNIGCK